MNAIARNIPIVNVSLEYQQTDHQSTMLEVEGKVLNIHVSILIDLGSSLSCIVPKLVEKCKLRKEKQKKCMLGIARNKGKKESYGDS